MAEQQLALVTVEPEVLTEEEWQRQQASQALDMRGMMTALAQAVVAAAPPRLSEHEKEVAWAKAFDEWLAEDSETGDPRPRATIQAYSRAWEDFRQFCPKRYWLVRGIDVKEWIDDLRSRPIDPTVAKGLVKNGRRQAGQMGLSPATINQWLAGISAFYSFCENYKVRTADGREVVLFDESNPAKERMVKRPKNEPFQDVMYLNDEQCDALLHEIRSVRTLAEAQDPRAGVSLQTIRELQDFALFSCYILTGGRNSEVRVWRWRNLQNRGGVMFYYWKNKRKKGWDELPATCWHAVQEYLRAAGRLEQMQPDDFVFCPLTDNITRMRRPDGSPVVDAETWSRNRPISASEANRRVRMYAERAGIGQVERLHVHCLRHSMYMLYRQAGVELEERSRLLHHSSLAITSIYDHAVAGQRNVGWARAARLLPTLNR